MKKNLIRLLAILLSVIFLFAGCDSCSESEEEIKEQPLQETEISIVQNGRSAYKIVVPDEAHKYESFAADEFKNLFAEATGIKLLVVKESEVEVTDSSKLFFIGETKAFASLSSKPSDLLANGFVIKRNNGNVFLCGGNATGTVYAVYRFMNLQFSYELYAIDEVQIETNVNNEKLLDYDYQDSPDFPFRQSWGRYNKLTEESLRLGLNTYEEIFVTTYYQPWHNILGYIPVEEYNDPNKPETYHPEWYTKELDASGRPKQIDFTAGGNAESLKLMQDIIFNKITETIEKDFAQGNYYEVVAVMQRDNNVWASPVGDYQEKYGDAYPAATLIHFLNPIANRITEYMNEHHNGRAMNLMTFGYHKTEVPPVKLVDGEYVPIDDSVVCADNMIILYAPIRADFTQNFDHKNNESYKLRAEQWSVLADKLAFWIYTTTFENFLTFYDTFYSVPDIYRFFKELNGYYIFNESFTQATPITFNAPKEYLYRKMQWDTELDTQAVLNEFFEVYYKDVAPEMMSMFNDLRSYYAVMKIKHNLTGYTYEETHLEKYWPEGVVDGFLKRIEDMYAKIEPLKNTNPDRYQLLKKRINCESIMFRYIKLSWYSSSYSNTQLIEQQTSFKTDCLQFKLEIIRSGKPIDLIWQDWKI